MPQGKLEGGADGLSGNTVAVRQEGGGALLVGVPLIPVAVGAVC